MSTLVQRERLSKLFAGMSGFGCRGDIVVVVRRMTLAAGLRVDDRRPRRAEAALGTVWAALSLVDSDGDGRISCTEFLSCVSQYRKPLVLSFATASEALFDLADLHGRRVIGRAEFMTLARAVRLDEPSAHAAFTWLDRDADGLLRRAEVRQQIIDLLSG